MDTDAAPSAWWAGMTSWWWIVRVVGLGLVAGAVLERTRGSERAAVAAALAGAAVLLGLWVLVDRRDRRTGSPSPWVRTLLLCGVGAVGGVAAPSGRAGPMLAFTVVAGIAAGSDLDPAGALAVAAVCVAGIEVGAVLTSFSAADAVGLPLVVVVSILGGRTRRDARIRSAQAAALMARSRQAEAEQRRVARLEERSRIARELHDVLAHTLSAVAIQIEAARAVLDDTGDTARASEVLADAGKLAASGLEEVRDAVRDVRRETGPLAEGIQELAADHRRRHATSVEVSVEGRPGPAQADGALLAVIREALTNAARHAPGESVRVALAYDDEVVSVTVANAAPVPVPVPVRDGFGVRGMRERLALAGGTLTAGPDGGDWVVRAGGPR